LHNHFFEEFSFGKNMTIHSQPSLVCSK